MNTGYQVKKPIIPQSARPATIKGPITATQQRGYSSINKAQSFVEPADQSERSSPFYSWLPTRVTNLYRHYVLGEKDIALPKKEAHIPVMPNEKLKPTIPQVIVAQEILKAEQLERVTQQEKAQQSFNQLTNFLNGKKIDSSFKDEPIYLPNTINFLLFLNEIGHYKNKALFVKNFNKYIEDPVLFTKGFKTSNVTLLKLAALLKESDRVQELLDKGANPNFSPNNNWGDYESNEVIVSLLPSPLWIALENFDEDTFSILVQHPATQITKPNESLLSHTKLPPLEYLQQIERNLQRGVWTQEKANLNYKIQGMLDALKKELARRSGTTSMEGVESLD